MPTLPAGRAPCVESGARGADSGAAGWSRGWGDRVDLENHWVAWPVRGGSQRLGAASEGKTPPSTPGIASPSSFTPPPPGPRRSLPAPASEYTKRRVRGSFAGVHGAVRSLAL